MQPEKIDLTQATISDEKLAQLRDLLPEVFHEGKIDFDELRNALGAYVEDDPKNERFGLRWPGKSKLQQVINTPSVGTLVPMPDESVDWDTTGNIIIEGDNLEVLKLLQKSYAGKVKMIYIDPPYNTGNDFVYPDKYASGIDTYLEFTGQKDEKGRALSTNSDTSGRYHANWLNMMYPRLYLAKNLLRQDGVIFVSIDDRELPNLLNVAFTVFGEDSHLANIAWKRKRGKDNSAPFVSRSHEYLVAFARSIESASMGRLEMSSQTKAAYSNPDNDPRGPYRIVAAWATGQKSGSVYAPVIYGVQFPTRKWVYSAQTLKGFEIDKKLVIKGASTRDGEPNVYLKVFEADTRGQIPDSVWTDAGNAADGADELKQIFDGEILFSTVKPMSLLQRVAALGAGEQGIVLDFFAGSGTTGHAVMQQNAEDGGNRKYILVQLPEPMEPKTLDDGTQLHTIADICRERVRRAGRKIRAERSGGSRGNNPASPGDSSIPRNDAGGMDVGFRAYKLAPSNFTPWNGTPENTGMLTSARQASFMPQTQQLTLEQRILQAADHLHPQASDIAILTELLLKLGEELTVPMEELTLVGTTVYDIDHNLRLICLDRNLTLDVIRAMAARESGEIICLDAGFPDDQTKVNAGQIIAAQAQHMEGAIAFKVV